MPSFTNRLQLIRHTLADVFRIEDYEDNWETLDDYPGIFITDSASQPTDWGARQTGQVIFETDTNLYWTWDGSAFVRLIPRGLIGDAEVTTEVSTANTSYETAVSVNVTVAAGNRKHRITVGASGVKNTNNLTQLRIVRDGTSLGEWYHQGGTSGVEEERPRHLSRVVFDLPTAGARTYTLEYRAVTGTGGTSTIEAGATDPIFIGVEEV